MPTRLRKVVFLWENFGPMHIDRLNALARATTDEWQVAGVQWTGKSTTYEWVSPDAKNFSLVTLFPDTTPGSIGFARKAWRTLSFCLKSKSDTFFFSHYNDPAIILTSMILALLGKRVFCMLLSKFDDYDRKIRLEVFKSLILLPYAGFLTNRGRRRITSISCAAGMCPSPMAITRSRSAKSALWPAPPRRPAVCRTRRAISPPSAASCRRKISASWSRPMHSIRRPSLRPARCTSAAPANSRPSYGQRSLRTASKISSFCAASSSGRQLHRNSRNRSP